jgi:hypothetical protein
MARARKAAEQDTSFNPTEFDPTSEQDPEGHATALAPGNGHSVGESTQETAPGYVANPSATRREPISPASRPAKRDFKPLPDPTGIMTVALSEGDKAPEARLLRSKEHGDMWMQFSENPGEEIRGQLKEAGFIWEPRAVSDFARGAWVLPLEPGNEWRNHAYAEGAFKDVVNQIRERNGMEPFVSGAGQGAA